MTAAATPISACGHDLDARAEAILDEAERAEPGRPELALLRTALAA